MKHVDLYKAHEHSINNKEEILNSKVCGSFYCQKIFKPENIKEWIDEGELTALCPYCQVDSVIGDGGGIDITKEFLNDMYKEWFE